MLVTQPPESQVGAGGRPGALPPAGPNREAGSERVRHVGRLDAAPRALWESVLVVVTVAALCYLQQWIGAFLLLVGMLGFGAWRVAGALFRPATVADRLLLAITTAAAWIVLVAEVLSAGRLLGQPIGWLIGGAGLAVAGSWATVPPRVFPRRNMGAGRVIGALSWIPTHPLGRVILALVALHLGVVFLLTLSTGINITDSLEAYLPRSVRYLQNGTFSIYDTYYDFMPGFHQTLVAMQLLFLRADVLVVPMSFLIGLATSVGIFAFSRSLGWPGALPLAAACLPWMMPELLLHASAPNFDILIGLWLLLALYFLRRGYAASSPRWLAAAALATGLALATKPTFWFAAPVLGLCWLATLLRALRRRPLRRTMGLVLVATVLVVSIGTPFIARNVLVQGTLLGPPHYQKAIVGEMSLPDRLSLLAFNSLALGYQLVTPPSLMSREAALALNNRFAELAQSLGFRLPDDRLTSLPNWSDVIRHAMPGHRYDSNHASFGAAFVLIVLPSMLALPLLRRRLGPRWPFMVALVGFGVGYFLVYALLYRYITASIRFLVEPMIVLAVIAPAWIALLPRGAHGPILAAFALLLIPEMSDVIQNSRWMPPDRVMQTARIDQIYAFNGVPLPDAARMLDRKYPPSELPEILIHDQGTGGPSFPDYTFLGPTLQRRTRYWVPGSSALPPGPLLTLDRDLANELVAAGMLPDRLGANAWLLLPNDRLRVRLSLVHGGTTDDQLLKLEASVAPGAYRSPSFGFSQLHGSSTVVQLRGFGPEPTLILPVLEAHNGPIRVEVRDGERGRTAERVTISRAVLSGL
jgi:hypothetical protein